MAAPAPSKTAVRSIPERIGKYVIIKEVGKGSTGTVYLSHDPYYGRDVAIKVYGIEASGEDEKSRVTRKMFLSEAHMVGMLQHPNILPIYDAGEENGRCYIVTEHVHGARTLAAYCKPDNLLRIDDVVEIMFKCAKALHYAHSRGVIHRDIKPQNIMVGAYGQVYLMDWGVAQTQRERDVARSSRVQMVPSGTRSAGASTDSLVGTPAYMAPEQAAGDTDRVDARSDIYSLCVLFHELLTLRYYLADKQTLQGLLFAVMNEPPPDLHAARLPQEFIHFLRRGLSKDPAQRFQSVAQMLDELQAIAEGRIHVECAFTAMRRTGNEFNRMVRDRPMMALTAFGLLIGMALFGVVAAVLMIALSR